jgi:hypothetical protein
MTETSQGEQMKEMKIKKITPGGDFEQKCTIEWTLGNKFFKTISASCKWRSSKVNAAATLNQNGEKGFSDRKEPSDGELVHAVYQTYLQ